MENIPISNVCLGGCTHTAQRLKSTFFEKKFFTPGLLRGSFTRKITKNVDFSLWGKHCIVLTKWTFFHVLAHCAIAYISSINNKAARDCKYNIHVPHRYLNSIPISIPLLLRRVFLMVCINLLFKASLGRHFDCAKTETSVFFAMFTILWWSKVYT